MVELALLVEEVGSHAVPAPIVEVLTAARGLARIDPVSALLSRMCDRGAIVGFITLRRNSEAEVEAVLMAISPEAQGSGIPRAMGAKMLHWAAGVGARRLLASTQVSNVAMQRALVRARFEVASSYFTIHKWYDR